MTTSTDTSGRERVVLPGLDNPRLLPVLPFVYLAWSDGELLPQEIGAIRERAARLDWLTDSCRHELTQWLDPDSPPSPSDFNRLRRTIRGAAEDLPDMAQSSLSELGLALARAEQEQSRTWEVPSKSAALADLEELLGVTCVEAARELQPEQTASWAPVVDAAPDFDVEALTELVDSPNRSTRDAVRETLRQPLFQHVFGLSKEDHRELVVEWTREIARHGYGALSYPTSCGGAADVGAFVAAFETLAFFDQSLVVKFGVQFGLFGGSILNLGTEGHHQRYLPAAGRLDLPGCFAMTERGHGSNVRDIETVARYDPGRDEFVIHTPNEAAGKDYIGNAADDGRMATVFAQLEVGDDSYGVHAFLVRIRRDDGQIAAGVRIEDCGQKVGLNGVDNGRLWFDRVRIPRRNLLDRFGSVSEQGVYDSSIPSPSRRFFTMLGTLVGGRVAVASAAVSASKVALTIAVRYADQRRQFGPEGGPEVRILNYLTHQRRLMPRLARTYALNFALHDLARRFAGELSDQERREIEVEAAGLKAYASWANLDTIQTCRECCGGVGYLAPYRFGALREDTDIYTTFEGDNVVLLQLVAKGLLSDFRHSFSSMRLFGMVRFLAGQARTALAERNPVVIRRTEESHLRDPDTHAGLLEARQDELLISAARRLKKKIDQTGDAFAAMVHCQDHLVTLANAYVEHLIVQRFRRAVESCTDDGVAETLRDLYDLYALWCIEQDRGWFLEEGYLDGSKAKAIRKLVNKLCRRTRHQALPLVDAFAIPTEVLGYR